MKRLPFFALLTLLLPGGAGCASSRLERAKDRTVDTIRARSGLTVETDSDVFSSTPLPEVRKLLKAKLNADSAVRLAVLHNKHVRAQLARLGISVADVVAASRPPNPRVEGHAAIDSRSVKNGNYGASLEIGLTQLLTMRGRKRAANHNLLAQQLGIVGDVMSFALEVRSTFHDYTASHKIAAIARVVQETAEANAEAAQMLLDAGNIPRIDWEQEQAFLEETRLMLALSQRSELDLREQLNSLFGVWGPYTRWQAEEEFPDFPNEDPDVTEMERAAIAGSLELAAQREQIEAKAAQVGLAKIEGILPDVTAGIDLDFEEGFRRVGPIVSAQLPLFDQGQAEVMRAMAELDSMRALYVATAIDLRSDARRARNDLTIARQVVVQYRDAIIPLRQRVTDELLRQYNAMNAGVFEVLLSKRQELDATQGYVRALRDYWVARAELVQIQAGGRLGPSESSGRSAPGATSANVMRGH